MTATPQYPAPDPKPDPKDEERSEPDELVDEMGEGSFPTSDPPSTWAGPDKPAAEKAQQEAADEAGTPPEDGGTDEDEMDQNSFPSSDPPSTEQPVPEEPGPDIPEPNVPEHDEPLEVEDEKMLIHPIGLITPH